MPKKNNFSESNTKSLSVKNFLNKQLMEHTKECEYRNSHDMIHSNCFCKCHKILMMD